MLKHSLGKGNGAYLVKNQACAVRLQPGMNPSLRAKRRRFDEGLLRRTIPKQRTKFAKRKQLP